LQVPLGRWQQFRERVSPFAVSLAEIDHAKRSTDFNQFASEVVENSVSVPDGLASANDDATRHIEQFMKFQAE